MFTESAAFAGSAYRPIVVDILHALRPVLRSTLSGPSGGVFVLRLTSLWRGSIDIVGLSAYIVRFLSRLSGSLNNRTHFASHVRALPIVWNKMVWRRVVVRRWVYAVHLIKRLFHLSDGFGRSVAHLIVLSRRFRNDILRVSITMLEPATARRCSA